MRALDGIKGIGKATLAKLAQLGIYTVEELLFFLPSKYVDLKSPVAVLDVEPGQLSLFEGEVTSVSAPSKRGAKAFSVSFRDTLSDKQTRFKATFFNQPYFHDSFYEGGIYRILGKTAIGEATLVNPVFEPADKIRRLDGVMTVYPLKGLIGQTTFAKLVGECIAEFRAEKGENGNFFADVLSKAHFPSTYEEAETAVSALASYDVATAIKIYKNAVSRGDNARKVLYNLQKNIILSFENALSVTPTPSQRRAFEEILADLTSPLDMSRIVSGDVGSGKTLVAFFCMRCGCKRGRSMRRHGTHGIACTAALRKICSVGKSFRNRSCVADVVNSCCRGKQNPKQSCRWKNPRRIRNAIIAVT